MVCCNYSFNSCFCFFFYFFFPNIYFSISKSKYYFQPNVILPLPWPQTARRAIPFAHCAIEQRGARRLRGISKATAKQGPGDIGTSLPSPPRVTQDLHPTRRGYLCR